MILGVYVYIISMLTLFFYNILRRIFKVNKTELVEAVAKKAGIAKKDADKAVASFIDVVIGEVKKDNKVQIVGFGTFEARKRAAREGINPQSKAKIKIAACKVPAFKAGAALKEAVK